MPSPFASKFLPWNPVTSRKDPSPFLNNPFGINIDPTRRGLAGSGPQGVNPQSAYPEQEGSVAQQQTTTPEYDFMGEYNKVAGNRPNRLAYQKAIEEGSPVVNRGKWAKFGAAFTAGASALGGAPADRAAKFGLDSYYAPQGRSDERFDKKVKGLGQLATMEDSDVSEKIKALETQRSDWYKGQENTRQNTTTDIAKAANERAERQLKIEEAAGNLGIDLSKAQLKKIEYELSHLGEAKLTDPVTGIVRVINDKGETLRTLGQENLSVQQEVDKAGATQAAIVDANKPTRESAERIAGIKAEGTKSASLSRLKNVFDNTPPNTTTGKLILAASQAVADNTLSSGAGDMIDLDDLGAPTVNRKWWQKDIDGGKYYEDAEKEAKRFLAANLSRLGIGKEGTTPAGKEGTTPPPAAKVDVNSLPKTASGFVTMIDPAGEEFEAKPEQVQGYLDKDPKVRVKDAATPNAATPATTAPPNAPPAPLPIPPPAPKSTNQFAPTPGFSSIRPPAVNPQAANPQMAVGNQPPGAVLGNSANVPLPTPPQAPIRSSFPSPLGFTGNKLSASIMAPAMSDGVSMSQGDVSVSPVNIPQRPAPMPPPPNMPANQGGMPQPPPGNPIQLSQPPGIPAQQPVRQPQAPIRIGPPEGDFNTLGNIPQGTNPNALPPKMQLGNNPIKLTPPPTVGQTKLQEVPADPEQFKSILETVRDRVKKETGLDLKTMSARRTAEKQAEIYKIGRGEGDKRPIKTKADGVNKLSKHQSGNATDLMFVGPDGKVIDAKGKKNVALYNVLGRIAKEEGLVWGGDWKDPYDPGHVQFGEGLDLPPGKK